MREETTKNYRFIMSNNQSFLDYLKDKVNQRIDICQKRLREAEQKRNLTEYIKMEAKIEAYVDIWSFLVNKDNITTKPGRLEDDPVILEYMKEIINQMKIQTDQLTKLYHKK